MPSIGHVKGGKVLTTDPVVVARIRRRHFEDGISVRQIAKQLGAAYSQVWRICNEEVEADRQAKRLNLPIADH